MITQHSTIVAIRSLNSKKLPPQIIKANWNIGKKCNFDCSYCSPHYHSAIAEHLSIDRATLIINTLNKHALEVKSTVDWWITGGEPFMNPKILDILKFIKESPSCGSTLGVSTNGSLPVTLMDNAMEYVTNMSISIHTEQPIQKILNIIDKIEYLKKKHPTKFINSSIIYLPGTVDLVTNIRARLSDIGIHTVIRKVRPNSDGLMDNTQIKLPGYHARDRRLNQFPIMDQSELKHKYKWFVDTNLEQWYSEYYSADELTMLQEEKMLSDYANLGFWDNELNYSEANSDDVLNLQLNKFQNWHCFSGTDTVSIEFDGSIYNNICMAQKLGTVDTTIDWPTSSIRCPRIQCNGNPDIIVRKCKSDSELHLINGQTAA